VLAGPLLGAEVETSLGEASVWQQLGWLEARLRVLDRRRFVVALSAGAGAHWLQARGQASPPLLSQSDDVWSALGTLGAHGDLSLSRSVGLSASLRAVALLPPAGVAVASERAELGVPMLVASLGVAVGW
jgi:hypothetical protein